MIRAEKAKRNLSEHILRRSRMMTVERLSLTEFRVTPGEQGKVVRIVRFWESFRPPLKFKKVYDRSPKEPQPIKDGLFVECFDEKTMEPCEANAHARHCSHYESVIAYILLISESADT